MTPALAWVFAALGLAGTLANIWKRPWCFLLWLPGNVGLAIHNAARQDWPQAALFAVYTGLAVWGWTKWTRINRKKARGDESQG